MSNDFSQMPVSNDGYKEKKFDIFKILFILCLIFLLVSLVFVYLLFGRANRKDEYIDSKVQVAVEKKASEVENICVIEKMNLLENPWEEYTASPQIGAFRFSYPRSWSRYEVFDIENSRSLSMNFNPVSVSYDSKLKTVHSALEVGINKDIYANAIKRYQEDAKKSKVKSTEEEIEVSVLPARRFYYKDIKLGQYVVVIVVSYRDETLVIKTDNYEKNKDYFDKFVKSFVLNP